MIIKGLICSENCEMNSIDSQQYHQNFYSMDPNFIILALYYSWIYDKDFLYWCAEFDLSEPINPLTINPINNLFCIFDDILLSFLIYSFYSYTKVAIFMQMSNNGFASHLLLDSHVPSMFQYFELFLLFTYAIFLRQELSEFCNHFWKRGKTLRLWCLKGLSDPKQ